MDLLTVKVISPQDTLFNGEAFALSSSNSSGNFDVLPQHADFITIVENQPITIQTEKKEKVTFQFPLAIIYTAKNNVTVYAKTEPPIL